MSTLSVFYFWEAIEHYLETGLVGDVVSDWFQGVEFWANRLVADPLMMILGYYLAQRFTRLVNPARVCSIVWFFVHVFVFPHRQYVSACILRFHLKIIKSIDTHFLLQYFDLVCCNVRISDPFI